MSSISFQPPTLFPEPVLLLLFLSFLSSSFLSSLESKQRSPDQGSDVSKLRTARQICFRTMSIPLMWSYVLTNIVAPWFNTWLIHFEWQHYWGRDPPPNVHLHLGPFLFYLFVCALPRPMALTALHTIYSIFIPADKSPKNTVRCFSIALTRMYSSASVYFFSLHHDELTWRSWDSQLTSL